LSVADPTLHWVGTWSAAPQLTEPQNLPPAPLDDSTLRQLVLTSIGGSTLRVRLSNAYGERPLTLRALEIAKSSAEHGIDAASRRRLMFDGAASVRIPAGHTRSSDPLKYPILPLQKLALTIAFGEVPRDISGHPGSRTTSFLATGDRADAASLPDALRVEHWYVLAGIDVLTARANRAVVALGDSLTDGRGSTTDGNDRWPDNLSRRLRANPATAGIAVLNQGIGGNALQSGGLGPTALERFERDVLEQPGVRWLIVLEGVNDLGSSTSRDVAERVIAAYRHMIDAAHARGVLAYGVPILPIGGSHYFSIEREAARRVVNAWIRAPGHFDALIDLDAALRDPQNPDSLAAEFDCGDRLHLNPAGYRRMADAVDLSLFS
jgi:lysophospholipase L1-like esterase